MAALRILTLLVTVALFYLLFLRSQSSDDSARPATAHSQYKEDMNRAQAAAKAMQEERKEADSN